MTVSPLYISYKTLERRTVTAAGPITGQRCVGYDSLQSTATGTQRPWGIAEHNAAIGEQVAIVTEGSCPAEVGAPVTLGQPLMVDPDGKLVPATTGQYIFARALGVSAAAGKFVEVHIVREGVTT